MKRIFATLLIASSLTRADSIVGSIAEIDLTTTELQKLLRSAELRADLPLETDPASLNSFVRATLVQRLVLQKARTEGHEKLPEVAFELNLARDAALVESYLRTASSLPSDYPSEAEIAAFYEENKASFLVPKTWHLAQIFISDTDPAKTDAAKKKLDDILTQLAAPAADFASIARVSSDERSSGANGGDIGWLQDNLIQPAIRTELPALKIGSNTRPIRLDDGWHIIRLLDSREANTPTLSELAPRIRATLRANKGKEKREKLVADLLQENPPAVNEIELLKLKR